MKLLEILSADLVVSQAISKFVIGSKIIIRKPTIKRPKSINNSNIKPIGRMNERYNNR